MNKPWYSRLYVRSPLLKIAYGILFVMIGVVILLFALFAEAPRMQAQTANWGGRNVEKGADLFANNCSSCHGVDGAGGAGPALNSKYFFTQRLQDVGFAGSMRDYVELTVAAGRPSKANSQWSVMMPTWGEQYGGPFRADQVGQVSEYIMNWESTALLQTADNDPWIAFGDTPSKASPQDLATDAESSDADPEAGPRAPQELFVSLGCSGCHILTEQQTDTDRGPVGPYFGNLDENAPNRVAGQSANEYVHNSIADPNAYVVEGYLANIMPQNLSEQMTEAEIDGLVQWLLDPNREQ